VKDLLKGKVLSFSTLEGGIIGSFRVGKGGMLVDVVDNYELKGITMLPALVSAGGELPVRE
jgi:hypothetical protein